MGFELFCGLALFYLTYLKKVLSFEDKEKMFPEFTKMI